MKRLDRKEWVFVIILSAALGLRQMTMTMIMPFLSLYGMTLKGATPFLTGVALGIYGLMQAIFQIPYGMLSDRFGNKKMMLIGVIQVMIGLFLGYVAHTIYILILSRALQGSGAILAIGYSWLSSKTSTDVRTRALSIMGMVIGVTATLSFVFGPLLYRVMSVEHMFLVGALLFGFIFLLILFGLEDSKISKTTNVVFDSSWWKLFKDWNFCLLNGLSFMNNYIITGSFLILPSIITKHIGLEWMWSVFTPAIICALLYMKFTTSLIDKKSLYFLVCDSILLFGGIGCLCIEDINSIFLYSGVIFLMTGYIALATHIPAIVNNQVDDDNRGMVNGVINSLQYVGAFFGAVISGAILHFGMSSVLLSLGAVILLFSLMLFSYKK